MSHGRWLMVGCGVLLGVAPLLVAAEPAPEEKTGVKVGEKAPAFKLADQSGNERTLEKLLEKGPVIVVFHRSASW